MAESATLPNDTWVEARALVAKLVSVGKIAEAKKLLNDCFVGFIHPDRREGELIGMMFMLDACHPDQNTEGTSA